MADPGFSPGGAPTPKIAIIFHIFAENCMKMKEFGPQGGRTSLAPPLDPPMIRMEMFGNFVHCESTTVSQRPLLDHDDIHTLRKSVFTKLCRNQYKPHQE